MKLKVLEGGQPDHKTTASGFRRMRALLRCLADSDEQYKHWPPLFGTESYWRQRKLTRQTAFHLTHPSARFAGLLLRVGHRRERVR